MSEKTKEKAGSYPLVPTEAPDPGALAVKEAARAFLEEAKGPRPQPASMPIISINHKDGGFTMPSGETVPEVSGYPIYYFQTRRMYKRAFDPRSKGVMPDCWSADMIKPHDTSIEKQSEVCLGCPMNEFGTARDGRGKMCGTYTWVFLMNPDFGDMPVAALVTPPSSISVLLGTRFRAGYFAQATAKNGVYEITWSIFRLKPAGDVHCVIEPVMGPALTDPAKVSQLAKFRNKFIALMDGMRLQTPAVGQTREEG